LETFEKLLVKLKQTMGKQEEIYLRIGNKLETEQSQMFGKPCFKVNKKAYVSLFKECMVFKLTSDAHAEALSLDGSELFDPSGKNRPMKEWVRVPFEYQEQWEGFAKAAMDYVVSLNK